MIVAISAHTSGQQIAEAWLRRRLERGKSHPTPPPLPGAPPGLGVSALTELADWLG